MYYRGAHAAILVYDITSEESFQDMSSWVEGSVIPQMWVVLNGFSYLENQIDFVSRTKKEYDGGSGHSCSWKQIGPG